MRAGAAHARWGVDRIMTAYGTHGTNGRNGFSEAQSGFRLFRAFRRPIFLFL